MSIASAFEREMLDLINGERAEAGLDPLRLDLRLNVSSEEHSDWMLRTDTFSHTGAGGSNAGERMRDADFEFSGSWSWGENVAWQSERGEDGIADDVRNLHESLMNSPGHRANILNAKYEVIGIGIEEGSFKGYDAVMVTQNFALTSAALQIDDGGSDDTSPPPAPEPEPPLPEPPAPNAAPEITVSDVTLGANEWASLADLASYLDADGDAARRFQIRDRSGEDSIRFDGEVVDASGRFTFSAADLEKVEIRGDGPDTVQSLALRVSDGEDWSVWDRFTVTQEAPPRDTRPVVEVDDFILKVGQRADLSKATTITDADGDDQLYFQLADWTGRHNFVLPGEGVVRASRGNWVTAEDFEDIVVRADRAPSKQDLAIRSWDGAQASDWDVFQLQTVADDGTLI